MYVCMYVCTPVCTSMYCSLNAILAEPKNSPLAVNAAIENQKVTATSDSKCIWLAVSTNSVSLLSDVADIF